MLALRLLSSAAGVAWAFNATTGYSEVWHDSNGKVCALGGRSEEGYRVSVPGVAEFAFREDSDVIEALAGEGISRGRVEDAFRRIVLPLAVQALGREVIHASGVLAPGGVVGLCGRSGTGKSTLAFGLAQRGYAAVADDALVIENGARSAQVRPLPFSLSLRDPAASFLGVEPGLHEPDRVPQSAPLLALILLERSAGEQNPTIRRVSSDEAFTELFQHAYCFTLTASDRTRAMVETYFDLASRIPVFRLCFTPSLKSYPAAVEDVAGLIRELCA